jgi:MFS family permease
MASRRGAKVEQARRPTGAARLVPRADKVVVPVRRGLVRLRRVQREVNERLPIGPEAARRTRELTVEGLVPEAARHGTYNFRRGVLNGVAFTLVDALIAPSLVLAWFISRLGAPNVLVGLLPAILSGGWFLPQLIVASRVQGLPRMMHWYSRVGVLRVFLMATLAVVTVLMANEPAALLVLFFVLYTTYAVAAGVSGIPWLEVVGKVVSPRRRGSFFGLRNFWGGLLALLAAGPIGAILSENLWGLTFPYNFALLFGLSTLTVAVGTYFWSSVREPAATQTTSKLAVGTIIRRGVEAFKSNVDYRNFMVARILIALASVADAFYVVYAKDELGAPAATVGLYLGALSISSLLSNFLWSPLADRASNRTVMTFTVVSVALVPVSALLIAQLAGVTEATVVFTTFTIVFILSGLALGAARIVNNNMLLTIAPPAERAIYVGYLNTVLGIVIFVPVIGGLLVDLLGFVPIFLLSAVLALFALFAALRMSTSHAD